MSTIDLSPPPEHDARGRTALHLAAEQGRLDRVVSLLQQVDSVDPRDDCKWTPLMRAAQNMHIEVVRVLIEAGADIHARDKGGYTALMVSAANDDPDMLSYLLKQGAAIDAVDDGLGWSALIWSAKEGRVDNLAVLLAAGADPYIRDVDGNTAYDHALAQGHDEIVVVLQSTAVRE